MAKKICEAGGYTITEQDDGSGVIHRFVGSPGEYLAAAFGPGEHYRTAQDFLKQKRQDDAEADAAERRCPQM